MTEHAFKTLGGRRLYASLPEIYRSRDAGDLAGYLDACGELLDLLRGTLKQRLADCFPDPPETGPGCQEWLIPYFARLVDARIASPHLESQRLEVARAIAWRQRKGTLGCTGDIAEAVTQGPVKIQEGWKRVAVTPRLNMPEPEPAVTMDFRSADPLTPEHYLDQTRRTVDVRTPDWDRGRYHPKRVLVYLPIPDGMPPRLAIPGDADFILEIPNPDYPPGEDGSVAVADIAVNGTLAIKPGYRAKLRRVWAKNLTLVAGEGDSMLEAKDCLFGDLAFQGGSVRLEYCTILGYLICNTLQASDCIFTRNPWADTPLCCIRYSRVPPDFPGDPPHSTRCRPIFFERDLGAFDSGTPGLGVLHPACPGEIRFGAEDGGEMGACHALKHCLEEEALLAKLKEYLPLGIEPVLIYDDTLEYPPSPS